MKRQIERSAIVSTLHENSKSEDIAHDILAKLAQNQGRTLKKLKLNTEPAMIGYLKKMVKNYHTDLIRQKMRNRETNVAGSLATEDGSGGELLPFETRGMDDIQPCMITPDLSYLLKDQAERISECLEELSPQYVTIIRMLEAKSTHAQIADELGVNVKSVGALVNRARNQLLKALRKKVLGIT